MGTPANIAESLINKTTYSFGANNPDSLTFDCSSFTQFCYKQCGHNIDRDTKGQSSGGVAIDKNNIMASDLIFFKGTYRDGVSHVGICINDKEFIHCSSTAKTAIKSKINDDYWSKHFYGVRRYLDSEDLIDDNKIKTNITDDIGLTWWGDIVKIVLIIILMGGSLIFLVQAIGLKIDKDDLLKKVGDNIGV